MFVEMYISLLEHYVQNVDEKENYHLKVFQVMVKFTLSLYQNILQRFEKFTPYVIGLIQLDEGPKVISQIVDCKIEEVYLGMPVEICFRKLFSQGTDGIICYCLIYSINSLEKNNDDRYNLNLYIEHLFQKTKGNKKAIY